LALDLTDAIDCDVHPRVPPPLTLAHYMDDYWRDTVEVRGLDVWETISYPAKAPLTRRPDIGNADADAVNFVRTVLGPSGAAHAICNCLFPVSAFRDAYMAAAFARAANDWLADQWLSKDARLKGSMLIPIQAPDLAVEEIERRAADKRFVQILLLVMGEHPLGQRMYWPIYEAAERHGFAIGIHAGSSYHHAVTGSGWPTHYVEDYAAQALGFHTQLGSFISEGVFVKYPKLKLVLIESGVTWLPPYLWRLSKFWRGVRLEVPWLDRSPWEALKANVRLTTQPFDAPRDPALIQRLVEQIGSDEILLYASDYPHWHAEEPASFLSGLAPGLTRKILSANALSAYARLGGDHAA
jgi:predicted TIM-barrel fold metal-dependent hydrolase